MDSIRRVDIYSGVFVAQRYMSTQEARVTRTFFGTSRLFDRGNPTLGLTWFPQGYVDKTAIPVRNFFYGSTE